MSLKLLIDEDTQAHRLVEMLRESGHDVLTISEAGVTGIPDTMVLEMARSHPYLCPLLKHIFYVILVTANSLLI
ncbi:MAG: DUF5615 family PIN-like protein [Nostocaceae cyanobacterium]|nr:DUF5615 family PIN-like protein [Nostocaceae cyanobacterium]